MDPAVLTIIILIVIATICIIYYKIQNKDMVYVKSDIDNKFYLVRDRNDKQNACNMLARLKENIFKLTNYVTDNHSEHPEMKLYVNQLFKGIQNVIIKESSPTSNYTSYCVNKGEELVFCLRIRKQGVLHDMNLMMYVVIHEISHVACPEDGHTELFYKIFEFLCRLSIDIGLYEKIPFNDNPVDYCGLMITDSIV